MNTSDFVVHSASGDDYDELVLNFCVYCETARAIAHLISYCPEFRGGLKTLTPKLKVANHIRPQSIRRGYKTGITELSTKRDWCVR